MLVIDAACWVLDGMAFPMARVLNYTVESIYYALHVTMPFFWAIYVELALSADMKAARRRLFIAGVPLVLLIAFLPFNIHLGWVFTIDDQIGVTGAGQRQTRRPESTESLASIR